MRLSAIIVIATLFVSCSNPGVPENILPPDKIRPIIFDLLRADEFVNNFILKDTLLKREEEAVKLYEQVFSIHKVKPAEFYNSYLYYQAHPDKNKILIDSLDALITKKRLKPEAIKPQ